MLAIRVSGFSLTTPESALFRPAIYSIEWYNNGIPLLPVNKKTVIMTITEINKQDIIDQLAWDKRVSANDVEVIISGNTVELRGTVPNYAAKMAAENDTYQVPGVTKVVNYLDIKFPSDVKMPGDQELSKTVESMLSWDSRISSTHIRVSTAQGIVSLSGEVNSYWEKHLATGIARSAGGVVEVINNLSIRPDKTFIDQDIERDIRNAFRRNSLLAEHKIDVNVNNGIVHLTGHTSNWSQKTHAYDIAMYTAGVTDVIDDIAIE